MTTGDGYNWIDRLIENKYAHKSIKDVWVAALSATAGFMVERRKLDQNPFLRLKVREDKSNVAAGEAQQPQPPRKGFTPEEAKLILTATFATPSHLVSVEMRAARRWLPWLCAYSGARVNELTSLHPDDIAPLTKGISCMMIKPSLEKTAQWRVVPIHSHVLEQDFMDYVQERKKLNKPLFYDPDRSRGDKSSRRAAGSPHFSMHLIRFTMGDHILDETDLPPGTTSLMIGHEIAGDRRNELDRVGQTGKRWYFQAQRIPEKTKAMEAWSEALLAAFKKAGGIYP